MIGFRFKDKKAFDKKIAVLADLGLDNLHIVADFDKTLTAAYANGKPAIQTWETFELGEEYDAEKSRMTAMYQPVEYDRSVPIETKKEKMDEWWRLHLEALIKHGLTRGHIEAGVSHKRITPRDGLHELCAFASGHGVPLLVFSAGLGDVIQELFRANGLLSGNLHIVSNFFVFDEAGIPTGFKDRVVHSYNKSEVQLGESAYAGELKGRKNVLLLGDSLGDVHMADGMPHDCIIRIGFLNGNAALLDAYLEAFDAVIVEDVGLDPVLELLKSVER
ncbi:MAG TPA: hypothetical protein VGE62_00390 [Candidatus Paceibacterota bacterium]